jgi:hypothetical protein
VPPPGVREPPHEAAAHEGAREGEGAPPPPTTARVRGSAPREDNAEPPPPREPLTPQHGE